MATLTREEFELGCPAYHGVVVVEVADGDYVLAWGHVDPEVMAAAVTAYDAAMTDLAPGDGFDATDPDGVEHRYAVVVENPGDGCEWFLRWADGGKFYGPAEPGVLPITMVAR